MEPENLSLSIEELAEQTQTPVRTVRYYIAERMLPGPGARGKGAVYTQEHLLRLRLIRRLTERRAPLAEIRELMARVSAAEVRALLAEEDARAQTLGRAQAQARSAPDVSPREYIAALLDQARAPQQAPLAASAPGQVAQPAQAARKPYSSPASPPITPPINPSITPPTQASAWRRVELAPGVELHIQQEAEEPQRALIERLMQVSRDAQDDS